MKKVSLLGSTGSIGISTLRVISEFPDEICVTALAAGRNVHVLAEQVLLFRPQLVSVAHASDIPILRSLLKGRASWIEHLELVHGSEGLNQAATLPESDLLVCAISGASGLAPALAAIRAGKQMALATKEALVMAGELVMREARERRLEILPIDSEHNAIHQCLRGEQAASIRKIILTGSGGPFRTTPVEDFSTITPQLALRHPIWKMGRKITIDSATLMNKGLEVIEAHWLFGVPAAAIEVLIHPQSTVHSMVEMIDGSIIAQLGIPDMRGAIQYVLTFPTRRRSSLAALDLKRLGRLDFEAADAQKFPCLRLAYEALKAGGTLPTVLNAANETAVQAFLEERIGFNDIPRLVERAMESHAPKQAGDLETLLEADDRARRKVHEMITASLAAVR